MTTATSRRTTRRSLALLALVAAACSPSGPTAKDRPAAGTPTDPVEVCTRVADVCRLDASRLGVCTAADPASTPSCQAGAPCLVCMSQH